MAHFAQLDDENKVVQVIVIDNNDILDSEGNESESIGNTLCQRIVKDFDKRWIQTSYNLSFRKNFAGTGYTYDEERDAFIPQPHYSTWILNESTCNYEPPQEEPTTTEEGCYYVWSDDIYRLNGSGWILKNINDRSKSDINIF